MLYPVFESRTKEAISLDDYSLAELRGRQFIEMCPTDSRARLNLGQVLLAQQKIEEALKHYRTACLLGPPGSEVAWFMLGQCYEALDQIDDAYRAYAMSLHFDPDGIFSREALIGILKKHRNREPEFEVIKNWADELTMEYEATVDKSNPNRDVKPYQRSQFEESANKNAH